MQSKFRLLVVRLGAMGDILHALPAVTALRMAHPGWIIDWVVEPQWRPLLAAEGSSGRPLALNPAERQTDDPLNAQPVVDRLHFAATKRWRKAPLSRQTIHEVGALRSTLRKSEYDAVIDLQGALRSAVVARMAGCRRLIGEAQPREQAASWLFSQKVLTCGAHVIEQDIELASTIAGDELKPVRPWLPVDPAAEAWADQILPLSAKQDCVLINPGAGWGAKRWPIERYASVARGLAERGLRVLVSVGPGEEQMAQGIAQQSEGAATALPCTLPQLIAMTRRIALEIAGDTGPLHLACALGRPVVGIYGPTDPRRNGPFGARFKVLRNPESRRDHTRRADPETGLLTIQPGDVLQAAQELLYPETSAGIDPANAPGTSL